MCLEYGLCIMCISSVYYLYCECIVLIVCIVCVVFVFCVLFVTCVTSGVYVVCF